MVDKILCAGSVLLLAACGPRPGPGHAGSASDKPSGSGFDAEAELAREAQGLSERSFADKGLSFRVRASAAPTLKHDEGVVMITIPIAEGGTVECFLYERNPDPGATLMHMLGGLRKSAEIRELRPGPLEVKRESPVVPLTALYTVEQEGGLALGQLKLAFHARYDHSSLCVHDQVGFSKTFREVSGGFFDTLEAGREDLKTEYTELSSATIDGIPAGFDRVMIFRDGKEERRVSTSLLLMLRSASDLVTEDSASSQVSNLEGRVTSGEWYSSESGAPELNVSLELRKAGSYHYEGTFKGKPIQGDFTHSDQRGLAGGRSLERDLKKHLKGAKPFSISHVSYSPGRDPTRPTEETYSRLAGDAPNRVRVKQGDMEAVGTLDGEGRFARVEATLGRMQLLLSREFVRGKP
jgi:hypothetical protein